MKKNVLFAAGLVAVLAVAAIPAAAVACGCGGQGGPGGPGEMRGHGPHHGKDGDMKFWKCPKAKAELALTDDQVKKLEAADADVAKKMDLGRAEMQVLKAQLHEAMKAAKIDEGKVKDLAKKIAAKKAANFELKIQAKLNAFKVLTAEQKTKLMALHEEMMKKGPPNRQDPSGCACKDGDKCDCGPDCKCGGDCQCGPDCKCGDGMGCQCQGKQNPPPGMGGCAAQPPEGGCGCKAGHDGGCMNQEPAAFGQEDAPACGMDKVEAPKADAPKAEEPAKK